MWLLFNLLEFKIKQNGLGHPTAYFQQLIYDDME